MSARHLASVLFLATACGGGGVVTDEQPITRRATSALSPAERERFDAALAEVAESGVLGEIVAVHREHGPHAAIDFLPWHRELLRQYELLLRGLDPSLSVPYWDWLTDPALPPIAEDPLDVPLPDGEELAIEREVDREHIEQMNAARACLDEERFSAFTDCLEVAHDGVHQYVGGTMARISLSAGDPLFFLHHSFVDKLWSEWEAAHPVAARDVTDLPLVPFAVTAEQILDLGALGIVYE